MTTNTYVIRTKEQERVIVRNLPAPGPTGPKGDAATIEVGTVETVPTGEPAEITNTGTIHDAVFNFKVPKGETGDPFFNLDGGKADSVYGGIVPVDGGGVE